MSRDIVEAIDRLSATVEAYGDLLAGVLSYQLTTQQQEEVVIIMKAVNRQLHEE